jgi:hypothetical protein
VVVIVIALVNVGLPLVGSNATLTPVAGDGAISEDSVTVWVVPLIREAVTVATALLPRTTEPLGGLTLTEKSKGCDVSAPIRAMAVFHAWKPEEIRYSPPTQKVDVVVGVGSVAASK